MIFFYREETNIRQPHFDNSSLIAHEAVYFFIYFFKLQASNSSVDPNCGLPWYPGSPGHPPLHWLPLVWKYLGIRGRQLHVCHSPFYQSTISIFTHRYGIFYVNYTVITPRKLCVKLSQELQGNIFLSTNSSRLKTF